MDLGLLTGAAVGLAGALIALVTVPSRPFADRSGGADHGDTASPADAPAGRDTCEDDDEEALDAGVRGRDRGGVLALLAGRMTSAASSACPTCERPAAAYRAAGARSSRSERTWDRARW